jgi:hypothetical protein
MGCDRQVINRYVELAGCSATKSITGVTYTIA